MREDYHLPNINLPSTSNARENKKRILAGITVLVPIFFSLIALIRLFTYGIPTIVFTSFAITYLLTAAGLELGYHRYFSHKSFSTGKIFESILAILGATGAQGPLFYWVSFHRKHHQFPDKTGDPHSPSATFTNDSNKTGFLHAHVGWLFSTPMDNLGVNIQEIRKKKHLKFINKNYLVWLLMSLLLPTLFTSIISNSNSLDLLFDLILWTGFVRIFMVQHVVWMINSICHSFGSRAFKSNDNSTNQPILAVLMWGAGWHNNHHAFPYSYHLQIKWYHVDFGGWIIKILSKTGLTWDLKAPSKKQIASKSFINK